MVLRRARRRLGRLCIQNFLEEKRAGPRVGETFRDCPEYPEVVVVPSGSFIMGSATSEKGRFDNERPTHRVSVRQPFAIGKYEVTREQYSEFAHALGRTSNGCWIIKENNWNFDSAHNWHSPGFSQTDEDPVVCISYEDAMAYTAWLSRKTGHAYRIPSEAEWEYAARAGTTTRFHFGNSINSAQANFGDGGRTIQVGSFPSNAFGLYEVHGNV